MTQITVVLADDHTVVRSALRMLLDDEDELQVVAEAGDVADAASATCAATGRRARARPQHAGRVRAWTRSRGSARQSPETAIVVLTMQDEPAFAREALQAGAQGYVLKEAADDELVQAVRAGRRGRHLPQPELGARLAAEPPSRPARPTTSPSARSRSCG